MQPRGGTELQLEMLYKHCDNSLLDKFQICTSIPGKVPLDPNKINILWQKNSYDQPNLQSFFANPDRHREYEWYIFNSHWCYEKFRYIFNVPQNKSMVIKNGCTNFPTRKPYVKGKPIKILYNSTPWRGLNVMLGAMQYVNNKNVTLDVYSSTEIYGSEFSNASKGKYDHLFDQAKTLPNVNYIGYKPHEYILKNITNYDIWCHPSIWEETFCIGALEAMSAGLYMITTNYGALYETCAEWPVYVNFTQDYKKLAETFAHAIDICADQLGEPYIEDHLNAQQAYAKRFYDWNKKGKEWENFLKGVISAKS